MTEKEKAFHRVFLKSPAKKKRKISPNDVMSFTLSAVSSIKIEETEDRDLILKSHTVEEEEPNDMLALRHSILTEMLKPGGNIKTCTVKLPFSKANFEKYFIANLRISCLDWDPEDELRNKFEQDVSIGALDGVFGRRWYVADSRSGPEVTRVVNLVRLKYEEQRDTLVTAEFCPRCNFRGSGAGPEECKHAFRIHSAGFWIEMSFTNSRDQKEYQNLSAQFHNGELHSSWACQNNSSLIS